MFAGEREDISKNTIAKKYEECFLVRDVTSVRCEEEEIEEEDEDAERSARLKCVWRNYTSFARARATFIFVAR